MSEHPLVISGLSAGYAAGPVIRDIDLTVEEGEFLGILGPNGGGKSTLLKTILGMTTVYSGTITVNGEPIPAGIRHIGYVPQSGMFDRDFPISAGDVVLMGLRSKKGFRPFYTAEQRKQADEVMESLKILHLKDMTVGELSGGQLQRVLIARALVSKPKVLLLDEPVASLDPAMRDSVYELLAEIHHEGVTVVMVTHDLQSLSQGVTRAVHLDRTMTDADLGAIERTHRCSKGCCR